MKHETIARFRRFTIRSAAAAGALVLALALATPALAGPKSHKHRHHGHGHHGQVVYGSGHWRPLPPPHAYTARSFVVPRAMHAGYVDAYRPYYRGHVDYAPHGHAHSLYYFPTSRGGVPYYEPSYYCGRELFLGSHVGYSGPRVSFHVAF